MQKTKDYAPQTILLTPKLNTLSKKKFKAGLESLFGEPAVAGMSPFLVEEKEKAPAKEKIKKRTVIKRKKRSSSKNFTSDLESLFSDALDKEYKEKSKPATSNKTKRIARKQADKPVIGLDALIRRTVAGKVNQDTETSTPLKRRLTITMERQKLEELKKVAKQKKAYLRDIIDDLVSDYLSNIESNKAN